MGSLRPCAITAKLRAETRAGFDGAGEFGCPVGDRSEYAFASAGVDSVVCFGDLVWR